MPDNLTCYKRQNLPGPDDLSCQKINDRTTPDKQMPDNNSLSSRNLWHWCRLWEWEQYEDLPNGPKKLTTQEKETLQK